MKVINMKLWKLHNEELQNLFSLPNNITTKESKRIVWAFIMHREMRNPVGKRPAGRPIHRWDDNTKMNLKEMDGRCALNHLAHNRDQCQGLVELAMNIWVP